MDIKGVLELTKKAVDSEELNIIYLIKKGAVGAGGSGG